VKLNEFTRVVDIEDIDQSNMNAETLYIIPNDYHGMICVAFLCPCGCGGFHLLPTYKHGGQKPTFCAWEMIRNGDKITLNPSLKNGCGAHFFIKGNKVYWC